MTEARWLFAAFALAFAIKVPMWPVHTWLPDAHTNAPTAGSVILAGVMLKMGTYGFLRFAIPLFPAVAIEATPLFMALAVIGIIYGALVAMVQPDLKRLIAYSSVSHLGFVMLGIFALNPEGIDGAIYQMLNHGVSTGATISAGRHALHAAPYARDFRVRRPVEERADLRRDLHVRDALVDRAAGAQRLRRRISDHARRVPANQLAAVFAVVGVILGALYMLWTYERVMFGPITKAVNETIRDLNAREIAVMVPVIALMLFMGLFPRPLISRIEPSVTAMLARANFAQAHLELERQPNRIATLPIANSRTCDRGGGTMSPFNLAAINFVWLPILPMVIVAVAAIVVLLAGVRIDDSESEGLGLVTLASLGVAFVFTLGNRRAERYRFCRRDLDRRLFGVFSARDFDRGDVHRDDVARLRRRAIISPAPNTTRCCCSPRSA